MPCVFLPHRIALHCHCPIHVIAVASLSKQPHHYLIFAHNPQSLIHEGCLVPKSLYLSTIDEHQPSNGGENTNSNYARPSSSGPKVSQPHNSSLYKSADLEPGQLYELALRNDDPKSVLTWDFDVVTGNLQFTVFRCTSAAGDSSSSRKDESGSSGSGNSGGSILKSSIIAGAFDWHLVYVYVN